METNLEKGRGKKPLSLFSRALLMQGATLQITLFVS